MLSEISVIDSVRATESGHIEVRRADRVLRNGIQIAQNYHRWVLSPGDDLSGQDPKVVAIAQAVWTPEVVAAYQASQVENG